MFGRVGRHTYFGSVPIRIDIYIQKTIKLCSDIKFIAHKIKIMYVPTNAYQSMFSIIDKFEDEIKQFD